MNTWLQRVMYNPPWWAIILNSHFLPRRAIFNAMRGSGPSLEGRVLDVGCGTQPYRELLTSAHNVIGLELDTVENHTGAKRADMFYDGGTMPFPERSFQGVLCNQVLEHTFDPNALLIEIARILEPGGTLILSVPFFWPEHEQPHDSQRFTSFGLANRLNSAGFDIAIQTKLVPGGSALCALIADRINAMVTSWPLVLKLFVRAFVVAPWSILGCVLLCLPRRDPALYLDNFVVARKRLEMS